MHIKNNLLCHQQGNQITIFAALGGDPSSKGGQIIQKFGEEVRKFLTKFWIWAVTITLFAIGIVGEQMNLFKIIYMALALTFVITFQVSWSLLNILVNNYRV